MTTNSDTKPNWITRSPKDKEAMFNWCFERLWEEFPDVLPSEEETDEMLTVDQLESDCEELKTFEERGNVNEVFRRLAKSRALLLRYVKEQIAKKKSGRRRIGKKRRDQELDARIARGLLKQLRAVWRDHYGKTNRDKLNSPSAQDVVKRFCEQELCVILKEGWEKKH